jgi:dCTP diphosphatase
MGDTNYFENLKIKIDEFANNRDWPQFHTPRNLATSISIEAAELLECFQWNDISKEELLSSFELKQSVEDELADIMIYCLRFCSSLDFDVIKIMCDKIDKNNLKYPISKAKGTSKKYNKL